MLFLDYQDSRPIYEQIVEKFRMLILSGAVEPSSKMPSVRQLAVELSINPNTIQRAYNELEGEGYIYSVPGKGSFAAANAAADSARRAELLTQVRELLSELRYLGVSQQELLNLVKEASPS